METKNTVNQRFIIAVNYLIEVKSVKNKTELAFNLRLSKSKFSEILNGRMNVGIDTIALLCLLYEIETDWLLNERGNMVREGEFIPKTESAKQIYHDNIEKKAFPADAMSNKGIPLIPIEAMAGYGGGEMQITEFESERFVVPTFKGADFLIQVKGSSMYPKYNSGDIVACKKLQLNDLFFQWNKVYVLDTEQGALIKRIDIAPDDDHVMIVSDNEKYRPFPLHKSKINAISIVMGVIRLE